MPLYWFCNTRLTLIRFIFKFHNWISFYLSSRNIIYSEEEEKIITNNKWMLPKTGFYMYSMKNTARCLTLKMVKLDLSRLHVVHAMQHILALLMSWSCVKINTSNSAGSLKNMILSSFTIKSQNIHDTTFSFGLNYFCFIVKSKLLAITATCAIWNVVEIEKNRRMHRIQQGDGWFSN